ncbi:MAG: excinuclease ABC subunit UvrA [Chloroflexi bacterium]|nr:excinuclease ABC subunit UvrA [Chloroflexota bacterium]
MFDTITIYNARLHNLKNVTVSIPKNKLVVFTGVSGSGKSTLAIDTLFNEGQRQYMESLGMVDYVSKPPVDRIEGLSPAIAVDQHLTNRSPRSTVGTTTEVFTYLRILFARIGHRPCPNCGADIPPAFEVEAAQRPSTPQPALAVPLGMLADESDEDDSGNTYPCPQCGTLVPEYGMANFSFNKPAGACPTCTGIGTVHSPNLDRLVDGTRTIRGGAILGWEQFHFDRYIASMEAAGRHYGFTFDATLPVNQLGEVQRDLLFYGVNGAQFKRHFPNVKSPTTVAGGNFEGVATNLLRRYADQSHDAEYREKLADLVSETTCPDCHGSRLKADSRRVTVLRRSIVEMSQLPLNELVDWIDGLHAAVSPEDWIITEPIVADLQARVRRLVNVGVGYLALDRSSPTLSAGEAQRLRLASLLGSGLTGVLYVLDEPTIGLHPRDHDRLINVLRQLRDLGNTVLVIEHDLDMLRAADTVVDVGPGAGRQGGRIVAVGTPQQVAASAESITGQYLSGRARIDIPTQRRAGSGQALTVHGARANNLQNISVSFPLGRFVAVTGVSGSGKSSLVFDILDRAARQHYYGATEQSGEHESIEGWEHVDKIVTIDQSAIGRSTRSNAATYTDAFTPIREAFAATSDAKQRQLSARHFSFNVAGGRCERCEGAGLLTVEMHFLPNVEVRCPTCHGRRFKREVLAVKYRGCDIAQVLDMTIEEALTVFEDVPAAQARLALMVEVGLGYLQLGQPATTLSGGEAQRVKLAKELYRRGTGRTLYLLDEPTTGLHVADVARLLLLLQRLVDAGNTVVVVEHNVDVMQAADWIIDLGPEGGKAGGRIVAQGTPEEIAKVEGSYTGKYLVR